MNFRGIVHARIDDRLIHGQVAVFWCNYLGVSRIMVANDEVSGDEMRKAALRLVVPAGLRSSIISVDNAANNICAGKYEGQKVLLIARSPVDILRLVKAGVKLEQVNAGNLSSRQNTVCVKKYINVTPEELEAFLELNRRGIRLTAKLVPDSQEEDLMDYLKKAGSLGFEQVPRCEGGKG